MEQNELNQNRDCILNLRVSKEEKIAIRVAAAKRGMSMADYIRSIAVEKEGEKNDK